jgi:CheY-like chemotaxis protein
MNDSPLRVLIVDDSADSAGMLRVLLKGKGHRARVELDGESALAAAEEFAPDVALLDLSLPGMGGAEVAAEFRRRPALAGCSLVAITGHGQEALPSPSPFDRHFQKPVDHDALDAYLEGIRAARDASLRSASPVR